MLKDSASENLQKMLIIVNLFLWSTAIKTVLQGLKPNVFNVFKGNINIWTASGQILVMESKEKVVYLKCLLLDYKLDLY